jgi:hypothetical protein
MDLQKLLSAGKTASEIAAIYGVRVSTVSMRLSKMNIRLIGPGSPITDALPWDIAQHPDKKRLTNQAPFRGLRYYLRKRMGESLSERAELDLRAFLNRVRDGHVLALVEGDGFTYVPREGRDGRLVVRWPEGVPQGPNVALFEEPATSQQGEQPVN